MSRPDRSDEHLPPEEEARREDAAREYFDGIAPRRHTKPQRSDYSSSYTDQIQGSDGDDSIPELDKLRDLDSRPDKLVCDGSEPVDEYVETEYYTDLNGVDKQHHKTGTGFIEVEKSNGETFHLSPEMTCTCHESCRGNPATNDWIPSPRDQVLPASGKPNRSDI